MLDYFLTIQGGDGVIVDGKWGVELGLGRYRDDSKISASVTRAYLNGSREILFRSAVKGVSLSDDIINLIKTYKQVFTDVVFFGQLPITETQVIKNNIFYNFRLIFDFNRDTLSLIDFESIVSSIDFSGGKTYIVSNSETTKDMEDYLGILENYNVSVYYNKKQLI